ncbi:MAG: YerC/YecD family TrpR-related protein [Christensenellales bacterium]|jgi:TrpR-related protein YerC/YecD
MKDPRMKNQRLDKLYAAVLSLRSVEECYDFFEDICTITELQALAQRMEVAQLLDENVTYHEIVGKTGASTATISRVNRCLQYGAGGYRLVLDRMGKGGE